MTSDITLQASLHGGMIRALKGDQTFNISDHFFLGASNYLILFMFEIDMLQAAPSISEVSSFVVLDPALTAQLWEVQ